MKYRELKEIIKKNTKFSLPEERSFLNEIKPLNHPELDYNRKFPFWQRLVVGFSFAIFVLLLGTGLYLDFKITAAVTIDINPSVEIELNSFKRVRQINALNDDGIILVDSLTYKSGSLTLVLSDILHKSAELGFIEANSATLLFGVTGNKPEIEEKITNLISQNETLDGNTYLILENHLITEELTSIGYYFDAFDSESTYSFWSSISADRSLDEGNNLTTTAETQTTTTTSNEAANDTYNSMIAVDYGNDNLETLASSYGITQAKLELVLVVYAANSDYQTDTGFQTLVDMDISELISLYLNN